MTREKTTKELELEKLLDKRNEMITKVLGNLYKGKINNLFWNAKGNLVIEEKIDRRGGKANAWFHPPKDLEHARDLLLKNIHEIAKVFNEKCPEHLNILEFLLNKIYESAYNKNEDEVKRDIQEIKERCGSILMLLSIEAGN